MYIPLSLSRKKIPLKKLIAEYESQSRYNNRIIKAKKNESGKMVAISCKFVRDCQS